VIAWEVVVMSARVDQFCDPLRNRLNAIEGWLESVKTHIHALPEKVREALRDKLAKAHRKLQAQKKRVEQTRADLKSQPRQTAEIPQAVTEWKATREACEPHAGADPAEAHAAATIDHVVASIDEVRDAMLYAAVAQLHNAAK
jgi:chromosome segregation ATPase